MTMFSAEPGTPGDKERGKPRIWAEGRQRPSFDLRAFLRVTTANSRRLAAPVLSGMSLRLDRFGTRVEEGGIRIPAARLGRTGKWLPGHVATGRRLRDGAAMMRLAAQAAGGEGPVKALAFRGWAEVPEAPIQIAPAMSDDTTPAAPPERAPAQRPRRPAPLPPAPGDAAGDRDTLEAIRSLIAMSVVEPQHPVRGPKVPPPAPTGAEALPELAPAEPTPRSGLFKLGGQTVGLLAMGLAFPLGMAMAGYALARGDDLRLVP